MSIRDRFRPCSRDSSGGRTTRKPNCLIWFSRCSSAWWVHWARTKPVADAHLCNSCDVLIIDMLVDRHCFFLLHLICYGSPPGGAISPVPLWFPWWFLYVLLTTLPWPASEATFWSLSPAANLSTLPPDWQKYTSRCYPTKPTEILRRLHPNLIKSKYFWLFDDNSIGRLDYPFFRK